MIVILPNNVSFLLDQFLQIASILLQICPVFKLHVHKKAVPKLASKRSTERGQLYRLGTASIKLSDMWYVKMIYDR